MTGSKSGWFSTKELEYLSEPESVPSKERSVYRDRITDTVNEEAIYDLQRIPEILEFLNTSARETLRLQTEAAHVSRGLGELFPGKRADLIYGILLSEKGSDKSTDEFVDRFDSIWEELGSDVRNRIQNVQLSFDIQDTFRTFRVELLELIRDSVQVVHPLWDVKIRVPIDEFVEWTVNQKDELDLDYLPTILDTAFGITDDASLPRRLSDYWDLLSEAATANKIEPPVGEAWTIDFLSPSEADYERHSTALDALEDELRTASRRYWEECIVDLDALVALGLFSEYQLQPHDREILNQLPSSNQADAWTRYDTRRANILTDDRILPLLHRETIPKRGTDEKRYNFTEYGRFVHWLTNYVAKKGTYADVIRDIAKDAPEELVKEAIDWVYTYIASCDVPDEIPDRLLVTSAGGSGEDRFHNGMLWIRIMKETDGSQWES